MRSFSLVATLLFSLAGLLPAQHWEVGGSGGYSLYSNAEVKRGTVVGKTGFESGLAFGGVFANDLYRLIGGEVRYTFVKDALMVSSGSTKVTTTGQSRAPLRHTDSRGLEIRSGPAISGRRRGY